MVERHSCSPHRHPSNPDSFTPLAETQRTVDIVAEPTEPAPVILYSPGEPTVGEGVSFDARQSEDDGEIVAYEWNFGDGTTANGPVTSHTYEEPSEYVVTLEVVDDDGLDATAREVVVVNNTPPSSLNISYSPKSPTMGETVIFEASGIEQDEGVQYQWDFDGDGNVDATGRQPTHVFDTPGSKGVTLRAVRDAQTIAETQRMVGVLESTETETDAEIATVTQIATETDTATNTATKTATVTEIVTPTNTETETDAEIATTIRTTTVTETATETDTSTVTETATAAATTTATETPEPPEEGNCSTPDAGPESFTVPLAEPNANETVPFDASGLPVIDPNDTSYKWEFGDGVVVTTESLTTNHTYEKPGEYLVTVTIESGDRATSVQRRVTVHPEGATLPSAQFEYYAPVLGIDQPITFDASASTCGESELTQYQWDFDDDGTVDATGRRVTHVFNETGNKTIHLIVRDGENRTASTTRTLRIEAPAVLSPVVAAIFGLVGVLIMETVAQADGKESRRRGRLALTRIQPSRGADPTDLDDEYLVFENRGNGALELGGTTIEVEEMTTESGLVTGYRFPPEFSLGPGASVKLYTGPGTDSESELYWGAERSLWSAREGTITVRDMDGNVLLEEPFPRSEQD